ncbi:MAG: cadmium-translocating P-type ATPase [Rhizobiales bacterium]|nr:cadmium-translocating P-type ATPase [Hyphomicrobiales bacterium]
MGAAQKIEERYRVTGMDCAGCAAKIDRAVRRIEGVEDVSVSVTAGTLVVQRRPDATIEGPVSSSVRALGYGITAAPRSGAAVPAAPVEDHDHAHDHEDHDHAAHDHSGHDHASHHHADHDHASHDDGKAEAALAGMHGHDDAEDGELAWWQTPKARLTLLAALALAVAFLVTRFAPGLGHWPYAVAMLVGLVPIARRALAGARYGTPFSIETLMTIAAVGAVCIGASEEAAMVVFLFLIGEMLEGAAARRARASIRGLATLLPKTALLEQGGGLVEVGAETLVVGAVIQVRPGDRIAADGLVLAGTGSVDEAPVTGESVPKKKTIGDDVFAGTINQDAVLRVKVTAAATDNTIARVIRLVEEAQEAKAPTERFIDRFARFYTPGVLVVGALVAILPPLLLGASWDEWIYKGLAILLIGCPCALVISTPAAIAAGLANGARRGLLMKGGAVLEGLAGIDRVAFDKTGTLTLGMPVVSDIVPAGLDEREVLRLAAALETGSNHPLARAILARAAADHITVPAAEALAALAGRGVEGTVEGRRLFLGAPGAVSLPEALGAPAHALSGEGKSIAVLTVDGVPAGLLAMRDGPRPDAKAGLAALREIGIEPLMLTGDNRRAADAVGAELGLDVRAELLPADKQGIIKELQQSGHRVAKVGDGINDAPALAAADIGIAMGGGTDVALETADAAILNDRVGDVAELVRLARRTLRNIHQNVAIALGLKAVFLVTTILGITGLWPAILADTGATVLVTLNALTLLGFGRRT